MRIHGVTFESRPADEGLAGIGDVRVADAADALLVVFHRHAIVDGETSQNLQGTPAQVSRIPAPDAHGRATPCTPLAVEKYVNSPPSNLFAVAICVIFRRTCCPSVRHSRNREGMFSPCSAQKPGFREGFQALSGFFQG